MTQIEFDVLDVGCGNSGIGDVNVDCIRSGFNVHIGDQMNPKRLRNFVLADANNLPFKDESFKLAFSSHTIEHVENPFSMLKEICRVAKRKVAIRCPHKWGSGARYANHVNFFDENWFNSESRKLGFESIEFVTALDCPISNTIYKHTHWRIKLRVWISLLRLLHFFEEKQVSARIPYPLEFESWIRKRRIFKESGKVKFIVVYDDETALKRGFFSSTYVHPEDVVLFRKENGKSTSAIYNRFVRESMGQNVWFAFVQQDFILGEDLEARLKGKSTEAVYSPQGAPYAGDTLFGMVLQGNGEPLGSFLKNEMPVQSLNYICVIAHSSIFKEIAFDERFEGSLGMSDFSLRAYTLGFDVLAMQLKCQHKCVDPRKEVDSIEELSARLLFKEKWANFRIRTVASPC